jgi:uncharacterized protein YecT (DUF1311 family)
MKKIITIAAAILTILSVFSGCSKSPSYSVVSSEDPSSSETSSIVSSQASSSEIDASVSSAPTHSSETSSPEDSFLPKIDTENDDFDAKFAENVLDRAYEEEIKSAYTTTDWVMIATKYAEQWQSEIDNAYKCLLVAVDDTASVKADQAKWQAETDAKISELKSQADENGGSLVRFNVSNEIMLLYRSRAAELYEQLYAYDPDFSFSVVANG